MLIKVPPPQGQPLDGSNISQIYNWLYLTDTYTNTVFDSSFTSANSTKHQQHGNGI